MNDKKIAVIIFKRNEEEYLSTVSVMQKLIVPPRFEVELITITEAENYADAYQSGMKASDAKYKIYITEPVKYVHERFYFVVHYFSDCHPDVGIIGLYGSSLPIDGNYAQNENSFGTYYFGGDGENVFRRGTKIPLYYQEVGVIDPCFFVTVQDIEWDNEMGDFFFMAAQCCRMRKSGYKTMIFMQNDPLIVFNNDSPWLSITKKMEYERERIAFIEKYNRDLCPLVSILIPTYNQPKFFEEALKSALAQDYANIEIVVGDDSTNEETKKLIQPYLKKYNNIRYYYHGGPLGGKGQKNWEFVLNKAKGEYINYLLHDDVFYPGKIRKMMGCYLSDLNNEIGIVVSARDCIDADGKIVRRMNPWRPQKDENIDGKVIGARILMTSDNFLGEMTTALFRKGTLMTYSNESGNYAVEYFCGILDHFLGDVATWLEICRKGNRCVYLAEPLSAFRVHGEQNSNDAEIIIGGTVQWLIYYALAWLNGCFLREWSDYEQCVRIWLIRVVNSDIRKYEQELESGNKKLVQTYRELKNAAGVQNYKQVLHLTIKYMLSDLVNKERLSGLCQKDKKTGYWEKKLL